MWYKKSRRWGQVGGLPQVRPSSNQRAQPNLIALFSYLPLNSLSQVKLVCSLACNIHKIVYLMYVAGQITQIIYTIRVCQSAVSSWKNGSELKICTIFLVRHLDVNNFIISMHCHSIPSSRNFHFYPIGNSPQCKRGKNETFHCGNSSLFGISSRRQPKREREKTINLFINLKTNS